MSIAEKVAAASAYLIDHPDEARYRDSVAHAHLEPDLAVAVEGPSGEMLRTDMPAGIGGTSRSPSPGWYFRAALAACVAALVGIRAAGLGITLDDVDVVVDSESDDRGILGLDPAIPAGPLSGRVAVTIKAAGRSPEELDALGRWAVDHCPMVDALRRAVPTEIEIHVA